MQDVKVLVAQFLQCFAITDHSTRTRTNQHFAYRLLSMPATPLDDLATVIAGSIWGRQHRCSVLDVCYSV